MKYVRVILFVLFATACGSTAATMTGLGIAASIAKPALCEAGRVIAAAYCVPGADGGKTIVCNALALVDRAFCDPPRDVGPLVDTRTSGGEDPADDSTTTP